MLILRARKNQTLIVSQEQRDILVGCILGDAYIEKRGKIQIEHSDAQKEYVTWKYNKLQDISYGPPKQVSRLDKRYGKTYYSYRFWTRQFFRSFRDEFYVDKKKIFPPSIVEISPITMATWYMDDGSLADGNRIILSTDSFDEESRRRLCNVLQRSFGVQTSIKKNGKLLIGTRESKKIFSCIKPFIINKMAYKIP